MGRTGGLRAGREDAEREVSRAAADGVAAEVIGADLEAGCLAGNALRQTLALEHAARQAYILQTGTTVSAYAATTKQQSTS